MSYEKFICYNCVSEEYISKLIKTNGENIHRCSYCKSRRKTIPLGDLAEPMHNVFSLYYTCRTDTYLYDGYSLGNSAEDVIYECLGVDDEIPSELHQILQENYNDYYDGTLTYSDDFTYKRTHHLTEELDVKWEEIKKSLQSEARFFNARVKVFFDQIFSDLESHITHDGGNAITYIDSNTSLFRARVFDSLDKIEHALKHPENEFGPPPHQYATSGRMNAQGIPVFYGAMSSDIAIAEVRPAVGSYVVVAQFKPVKPLRILDISALDKLIPSTDSLFDPETTETLAISSFLKRLSYKLTIPISGTRTDSEYLITQAVSEYLSASEGNALDGIKFKSTQKASDENHSDASYNIVLFTKSSAIVDAGNKKSEYSVTMYEYDYDDDDDSYHQYLSPEIRKKEVKVKRKQLYAIEEQNNISLQLDIASLAIHEIKGVTYQHEEHKIRNGN
ncbi:RES domain-containing protein [Aeromonas salmonicida]|uniref:RES domain-containing protein n=1 Tax=Aeromonas salmonicida TaxID=645 RepID=UPI003D00BD09